MELERQCWGLGGGVAAQWWHGVWGMGPGRQWWWRALLWLVEPPLHLGPSQNIL